MALKIFVNGTFDLLHRGHLELLKYAASLGTVLVGIDSDRRVRELKGEGRPIINQEDRKFHLMSLRYVLAVGIFDSAEELDKMIATYQPDVMVKGSDYRGQPIVGEQHCKKIVFFDRIEEYATTKTIQSISDRR
jgi:D-beta-D-heptose 7-phosphate kinase/D-beta-D-heptose 1-phosphate adenosyltransferase